MPGLTPEFTMADINRKVDRFTKDKIEKSLLVLSYVGVKCVNYARKNHTYTDQSGNLTASIGYAVIFDGVVKNSMEMPNESADLIEQLAKEYNKGMVLVLVAGMEYAAAVESKSYDVITGASFKGERLMKYMKRELAGVLI